MKRINVLENEISYYKKNGEDYISLTDIARYKNPAEPKDVVKNWMRNRSTIEFLGLWEKINNNNFKGVEFDSFMFNAGDNSFVLSPKKWIESTNAIGLISKRGKFGGGTFAAHDIAFEFASWISVEFRLYLIKEFQRLKQDEIDNSSLDWNIIRNLAKINYSIHTEAIRKKLVPKKLGRSNIKQIYANEADILNIALFGQSAKEWKTTNPNLKGNMRDYADISQLICLSNLESLNSILINEGINQRDRLLRLNEVAISQMEILINEHIINKMHAVTSLQAE
ncbi:DNA-binding protein [archaeon D22]|nr:DNA-binding protein [archaeon D22]